MDFLLLTAVKNLRKLNFPAILILFVKMHLITQSRLTNQSNGLVYVGKVAYKYKGDMPRNTKITVKSDTVSISESAFKDCANLTAILIPSSVKHIDKYAFYNCQGLTKNLTSMTALKE